MSAVWQSGKGGSTGGSPEMSNITMSRTGSRLGKNPSYLGQAAELSKNHLVYDKEQSS